MNLAQNVQQTPSEESLRNRLGYAAKSYRANQQIATERQKDEGTRNFKRMLMGFCGEETRKSIDEVAEILARLHITDSIETGRKLVERHFYNSEGELPYNGGNKILHHKHSEDAIYFNATHSFTKGTTHSTLKNNSDSRNT